MGEDWQVGVQAGTQGETGKRRVGVFKSWACLQVEETNGK